MDSENTHTEHIETERWRLVDRIFESALDMPPHERGAFLDLECASDSALRSEVESLIAHDRGDDFLEAGASAEAAQLIVASGRESLVGQQIARFEVEARLGAGSMGEVYRAHDPLLGRPVALKRIPAHLLGDADREQRFRREALATSALNHPNILTVYEIVDFAESDLLVTELVDGVTLRERLRTSSPLPIAEALDITLQIARGLAAAHEVGVVHRDIKPENVMVRRDGLVKVLDFGIAKSLFGPVGESGEPERQTRPGEVLGTVRYMSPEQVRGLPVDARTDVWSLGVVLYELVTGAPPFHGTTDSDCLAAILLHHPDPPNSLQEGVPYELGGILARALAKERDDRYPDASIFAADLEQLLEVSTNGETSRPTIRRQRSLGSRLRSPGGIATTLGVVLLAAVSAMMWIQRATTHRTIDSIAVLPLVNVGGDERAEYLSDGITESLIQSLALARDLKVMSRAAVFPYKGKESDTREIGRALGVQSVLTGRLTPSGDRLSVTVELVDARDNTHLWGSRYDIPIANLPTIHETISREVHRRLNRSPSKEELREVARLHSHNVDAYQLYLKGRYYWYKSEPEQFHKSLDFFLRAIETDPGYALAWSGLGRYYGFAAASGLLPPQEYWPRSEQALLRALEIDPAVPEVYAGLASVQIYWYRDWEAGEKKMQEALERFPEALHHYSLYLALTGHFEEAIRHRMQAFEMDPVSVRANRAFGSTLYYARHYEEAVEQLRRTLVFDPADIATLEVLGDSLAASGRNDAEAISAWRQALLVSGQQGLAAALQNSYDTSGLQAAIVTMASGQLAMLSAKSERGNYVPAFFFAKNYLRAGDRQQALRWADKAFDEQNRLALEMVVDPIFDPLRDDPSFRDGVHRLGLPP